MKLFKMPRKKCVSCEKEYGVNELTWFVRQEKREITTWGLRKGYYNVEMTVPTARLLVCAKCFIKLTEEQDQRLKGIVKCEYCDTLHKTGEKCPTCGAH